MSETRVLVVGAHPDDAEVKAGGLAARHADRGNAVRFVSVTDGSAGHHELDRAAVAARRGEEADRAADVLGVESGTLGVPDGELRPTLEHRERVVRLVRGFDPDLLLTHRPNDYHPDHRYTARLVEDAAYLVRVPNVCPDADPLDADPVICYLSDTFEKPRPFEPDAVVAIDGVIERKLDALHEHASQVYEWLPWTEDVLASVPDGEAARRQGRRVRRGVRGLRVRLVATCRPRAAVPVAGHPGIHPRISSRTVSPAPSLDSHSHSSSTRTRPSSSSVTTPTE